MAKATNEQDDERGSVISFRASTEVRKCLDDIAADEGLRRGDVARRAVIRDLRARRETAHG